MMAFIKALLLGCLLLVSAYADLPTSTQIKECGTACAVYDVVFPDNITYIIQTNDGSVYRSGDEGSSFIRILTQVRTAADGSEGGLFAYEQNKNNIFFKLSNGGFARTTDGGKTTSQCSNLPDKSNVVFTALHKINVGWIALLSCSGSCQVFYSQDFGDSWKSGPSGLSAYPIFWSRDSNSPTTIFGRKIASSEFGYTKDFGGTWVGLFQNALGYVVTDHYVYVGINTGTGTAKLYSSSNRNDASHLLKEKYWLAEFPTGNTLPELGYTFLDDTTRAEFIAVRQSLAAKWGDVYASDFDGDQFALALHYVAQYNMLYDFDKIEGLNGIYFANAYPTPTAAQPQTKISYDNGGDWQLLTPPAKDVASCSSANNCSLHLHGTISWVSNLQPPFYTSQNAIGLLVAVGNLGKGLDTSAPAKTYFSRDAGHTWAEIFNQPSVYEFGDHGGIFVFTVVKTPTTIVYYSLDEGKTISNFTFTDTPIVVGNIFIEPTGVGRKFVLIGQRNGVNYIFSLDFNSLKLPSCGDNDYEKWIPTNGDNKNTNCFMGEMVTYSRRKQDSQCFNDKDTDHIDSSIACSCDWEDYECDVGYSASSARNDTDGFTCTADSSAPSCATGYRKIPDTKCTAGLDLTSKNCPGYSGSPTTGQTSSPASGTSTSGGDKHKSGGHAGVVFLVILLLLIFGSATTIGVLYWKNDRFRELVQEKLFSKKEAGYGRLNTAVDDEDDNDNNVA